MRVRTLSLTTLACVGLLAANGCPPQTIQETKLLASAPDGGVTIPAGDQFGFSVSISGDVAVIGARWHDFGGSAYVYHFNGTDWVEEAQLLNLDGEGGGEFGFSVSIDGDVAVIGAPFGDPFGPRLGSAYVYRFDGTDWIEEAKLVASDGTSWAEFGFSVSIDDDVAVIGARKDDGRGLDSGSAYVYRFDGTGWIEETKLLASDATPNDYFGASVSISGDVAVIGAPWDDDISTGAGSAYVYRFDGTDWIEEEKLVASDAAADDEFGFSVSISGDVAVIGARRDEDNGSWSGSAYVYRFDGMNWIEETKLLASDGTQHDTFGSSVSIDGDVAVVGADGLGDNGTKSGSAYVFRWNGTSWVEHAKLLASEGDARDEFGRSVSVSGNVALVGAWKDEDNGTSAGSAYVFSALDGTPACSDSIDNDGDGLADLADPSCAGALDTSEHSGRFGCDDGIDNDNDGKTDYPNDPACLSPTEGWEGPQCDDGIDNDEDGKTDYPNDPACLSPTGTLEGPQCDDGVDNDDDGKTDYPNDPACQSPTGTLEGPRCEDGVDNDGDGATDYPDDPGCLDPWWSTENPQCQDGINNDPDQDDLIDFDGGLSALGYVATEPDPECVGEPWKNQERTACGLGWELGPVLAALMLLGRRRRNS